MIARSLQAPPASRIALGNPVRVSIRLEAIRAGKVTGADVLHPSNARRCMRERRSLSSKILRVCCVPGITTSCRSASEADVSFAKRPVWRRCSSLQSSDARARQSQGRAASNTSGDRDRRVTNTVCSAARIRASLVLRHDTHCVDSSVDSRSALGSCAAVCLESNRVVGIRS